ncbi:ABC transporter permease [Paenactinomyces guangxiensis]|uniref:Sugar ABC transporter permease n=1 Tax=Paenactinomyces guangxiensis TaxID=1490290 RepID=A0A7W1WV12_9BACL|nr:ABC transporter permease subunit [Paenactinomyces guangxiensis]MBA4496452.1 sugar ABC transporter permease [Paenactinomyces guangxiensis]MBH8593568.1 sugar ABC transporter permease [Paenactinomyces guangxiensis]
MGKQLSRIWKDRYVYLLILPGLLYFAIYKYLPMFGLAMAFQDYSPFLGFFDSPWVGFKHFKKMFEDKEALQVIINTLEISLYQILFAFPLPIILAIMINEVRVSFYKRFIQSMVYLPHFLSWVVVIGIFVIFLRNDGLINSFLATVLDIKPIRFLTDPGWFKLLIVIQVIWKESGWGTIIILAALAGVNPQLYEAAIIDGASRWKQILCITLPAIRHTIIILLILRLGTVMDTGFEQIFLMLNPYTMDVGNVLDTFVYFKGIRQGDISFATAVGLFKGLVGLILVVLANKMARKFGGGGI